MPPLRRHLPRHGGSDGVRGEKGGIAMVRVKDLMTPQAEVISPDATAEDAASLMKILDIGVLPVSDEEGLVGILTDRDLVVRVLAAKRDPKTMLVGAVSYTHLTLPTS